jgi:hypothetical protein
MESILFFACLSCLFVHELDAMRCSEWRIFPGLHWLPDRWGMPIFVLAHIPLFIWIFYGITGEQSISWRTGLDIFSIIHLGLHLLFLAHPKNLFKDFLSWALIVGAALFGSFDLFWK